MKKLIAFLSVALPILVNANPNPTSMINGTKDERNNVHAFIHANIYVDDKTYLTDASLLIVDNVVSAVGKDIAIPQNALQHDLKGTTIYPSFIHLDTDYGLSEVPERAHFSFFGKETMDTTIKGAVNTNEAIKASYQALKDFHHDADKAKKLRKNGFGVVLSSKHDGIMQGTSVLVNLNDENDQQSIVNGQAAFNLSFDKGSSKQLYPISLMGASALIRQTWLDAQWYGQGKPDYTDVDLQAVNDTKDSTQIFNVKNWQQAMLADKIAKEFNKKIVLRTHADEYKHLAAIKKLNRSLIVPLSFPKALEVGDELDAWNVSLEKMMEWEMAPYNLFYLQEQNINFAIAPNKLDSFVKELRKAVVNGLKKSNALAALTSVPAAMMNNREIGHLKQGALANFIIVDGDFFEKDGQILENWIGGNQYVINKKSPIKSGTYALKLDEKEYDVTIENKKGKLSVKSTDKDSKLKYKLSVKNEFVTLEVTEGDKTANYLGFIAEGKIANIVGQAVNWSAKRISDIKETADEKTDKVKKENAVPTIPQPFSAYGLFKPSDKSSFLITNTTVWTNEKDGVLTETDVYINEGKIKKIGKNLGIDADVVIDGKGQHLSAGIIDEHSHIALLSVNDIATNSSMVRMEDALDSDNINIYRNLAGGVTAAQLLHGSANPLGGQAAMIKMRWGQTGKELLVKGADRFIKFALGENVKRSASQKSIRYPLTRMGVEQVYRDAFNNARVYEKTWSKFNKGAKNKTKLPRRDLMMEATLDVINQDLNVTCHSYVQSEINMLMKVADDYDFHINTFTHILEGYKVADKMLAHGVGASTFSDWWAYKWEVNYAIPYNASIMTKAGITTAINSDDAEMARRLNQEAAKSIKYGGLSEEQALKLVTLNPAKLLHLDDRMGSIKEGKDADIVLWSDNPMSIYAKANKTFVDGKLLFDRSRQQEIETQIANRRASLIEKMNKSDEPKKPAGKQPPKHMQCDSITGYEYLLGAVK